jgi:hypothetical protein
MASMADQPSPRRRFQFRLRTLMIVVTLLAVPMSYVGWQAKIVRERSAMREWVSGQDGRCMQSGYGDDSGVEVPTLIRRWLGDQKVGVVVLLKPVSDDDRERLKDTFPGVQIVICQ